MLGVRRLVHAIHYARRRGVVRTIVKGWRATIAGRERWYVTRGDLTHWAGAPRRNPTVEIRPARESDLPALIRLGRQHADTLRAWLGPGHIMFVAVLEGELIAYRCVSTSTHSWVDRFFALGSDQVYSFDLFTAPRLRGRGITQDVMVVMDAALVARGFREVVSIQRTDNVESIAMTEARSIVRLGTLTRSVFLGRVRFSFTPCESVSRGPTGVDTSPAPDRRRRPA